MIHTLPTNCRRKLWHLWARLDTDATINEVIPLIRADLFESVVFLHSQSILIMLTNDPQTADELPTKIITFVGEAGHNATINEITPLIRAELRGSVFLLHSQSSLTVLMNEPQTADELPTKVIKFVGAAGHRLNHKWSNSSELRRIVRRQFLSTVKVVWLCSWTIRRLPSNCRQKY